VSDLLKLEQQSRDISAKVDAAQSKIVLSQRRITQFKEEANMNERELAQRIIIAR
jgi:hypothetical protein